MAAERSRSRSRSPGRKCIALKEAIDTLVVVAKSWTEARLSLREAERAADEVAFVDALNQKHEQEAKAGSIPEYKPSVFSRNRTKSTFLKGVFIPGSVLTGRKPTYNSNA